MNNDEGPREILPFDKVDRAVELVVRDWLQWSDEFNDEKAQLALTVIAKRETAFTELEKKLKVAEAEVERLKEYEFMYNNLKL
jgi:hypothetical protein